jgi:hypothetical protein
MNYDLEKGKDAPFRLCEGILDNYGFAFMQICISRAWGFDKDMLDTALKWVKRDIKKMQEKDEQSETDDIKNRFTFTESQVFFDGKDLSLPTGSEIVPAQILKQLVESFGIVVSYKTLDENSDVTASDFLRGKIKQINNALKTHKVPCKIQSRTWFGYFLSHSRNRS